MHHEHVISLISLVVLTTITIAASLPVTTLSKRVFACPTGTLVCCHITSLRTLHIAQGCSYPGQTTPP